MARGLSIPPRVNLGTCVVHAITGGGEVEGRRVVPVPLADLKNGRRPFGEDIRNGGTVD